MVIAKKSPRSYAKKKNNEKLKLYESLEIYGSFEIHESLEIRESFEIHESSEIHESFEMHESCNQASDSLNHFKDSFRFMNLNQIYPTLVCTVKKDVLIRKC